MVLCPSLLAQSSFSFSPLPLKKKKKKYIYIYIERERENQYCHLAAHPAGQPANASASSSADGEWLIYSVWKKLLHTLFTFKCFNNQFFGFMFQPPNLLLLQTYHETLHTLNHSEAEIKFETNCTNSYILKWIFISKFQLSQSLKSF